MSFSTHVNIIGRITDRQARGQTIFSSSLIQAQQANASEINTHFVFARQFWLFIVMTVPLMLLTAGYMIWVEKR